MFVSLKAPRFTSLIVFGIVTVLTVVLPLNASGFKTVTVWPSNSEGIITTDSSPVYFIIYALPLSKT